MKLTRNFSELSRRDTGIAGGKGASLGEMTQAGIPVPQGFVLLSDAFERFIEETDLSVEIDTILHSVNKEEMRSVEHASERIQALILGAKMPKDIETEIEKNFEKLNAKFVAVRSSATAEDSASATWAGQLDTFLNTTEKDLMKNVQKCWASLFTPRAIFYRFEKDLHNTKISVAVVVQKMVESEFSGIAFSVHPVTEDRNQLIINAGFGLGEAIVSGQITPDSYVVEKTPRRIIDKNINTQTRSLIRANKGIGNEWINVPEPKASSQVLTDKQILELSELILKIENHYGFPCDIEWAYEKGKFYIVQSRPITTLKIEGNLKELSKKILTKLFSRQVKLYYFSLWDRGDRKGIKKTTDFDLKYNLFLFNPRKGKSSVWYQKEEIEQFKNKAIVSLGDPNTIKYISEKVGEAWQFLESYAHGKEIENISSFVRYNKFLVQFWSNFNTAIWESIDSKDVPDSSRKILLELRDKTQEYSHRLSHLATDYFEKTLPKYKDIVDVVSIDEMTRILKGKFPKKEYMEILKRKDGCFIFNSQIYLIDNLEHILSTNHLEFDELDTEGISELRGDIACVGKYTGKIAIVDGIEDLQKVKEGYVLVTQMTNPKYLPQMKIAGAFVTDEGGMLCHAAIVARELKKPCVIGTKVATQVLKDGDLVEVDADRGVVKILKRGPEAFQVADKGVINLLEEIKNIDWQMDWSGKFPLMEYSMANEVYLDALQEVFEISFSHLLIIAKADIASGRFSKNEYINVGSFLAKKGDDKECIKKWAKEYKRCAAILMEEIRVKPEKFLKNIESFNDSYKLFGAYTVATKIFFDFYKGNDLEVKNILEDARKFSEPFYWDNGEAFEKMGKFIAKETKYKSENVLMMTRAELFEYASTKKIPNENILKGRFLSLGLYWNEEGAHFLSKEEVDEIEKGWLFANSRKIIRGTIAYKGKVKGKCRIVHDYKHGVFYDGEILVTGMTNPNYTPLVKKALAIITDAGGTLSHAAIISRELKKPCIIGTKVATQVLKDGDLVEVDADNGVVRIIKKVENDIKWNEFELEFRQRNRQTVLFTDLYFLTFKEIFNRALNLPPIEIGTYFFGGNKGYQNKHWKKAVIERIKKEATTDRYPTYVCKSILGAVKKFKNFTTSFLREGKKLAEMNNTELAKWWHDYADMFAQVDSWFIIPWWFTEENVFTDPIIATLQKYRKEVETTTNFNEAVAFLVFPKKETAFQKQEREYAGLLRAANSTNFLNSPSFKKKAKLYLAKYAWMSTFITLPIPPLSFEEICARVGKSKEQDELSFLKKKEETSLDNKKKLTILEKIAKQDKVLWRNISWAREFGWILTASVENLFEYMAEFLPLYGEIARRLGITDDELTFLRIDEVIDALHDKKSLSNVNFKERMRSYSALFKKGKENRWWFGEEAETLNLEAEKEIEEIKGVVTELKGVTASSGNIEGKVRIVLSSGESNQLQEGEILVTAMTDPGFVPAMKRAGAIVTDEGGLLSHAAIMSREFGKPCIVGTKIATRALKDGDLVEVDADNGVVRILKRV
ncbi:MAG: PEP/pyruvate-binding domain-containing protein [Patescibacteria group bacterium]